MPIIYINGHKHENASDGKNLLEVCLSLGYDLPYFCWHPALGSVGACRQCAVKKYKDAQDKEGNIVMACMEPVTEGLRISISDKEAHEFRANIISWLMINHPHDCPVCDEGGECHLQDMTVMSGHNYRSFRFKKQTFRNQDLGPFINHEMNRCIDCFRCVRFYRDYAGGKDLNAFASRDRTYFGRQNDGTLESEFSGNLVEVCPTGVFTDNTLKNHYTRKWDLQNAPSVCVHCSLGCNIIVGERSGTLRRVVNRYNSHVNGYFLCDRGRFGFDFVNSPDRIIHPLRRTRDNGSFEETDSDKIIETLRKDVSNRDKVIGIGSPRASLEANYALRRLVGAERFYHGVNDRQYQLTRKALEILQDGPNVTPSLSECSRADAVLILGEDLTNTAPMMDLAIRQAVRQRPLKKAQENNLAVWNDAAVRELTQDDKGPLYISTPVQTKLDSIATGTFRASAIDSARFGNAIACAISKDAPAPDTDLPQEIMELARRVAQDLQIADNPLIVTGTSSGEPLIIEAAANIARALDHAHKPAGLCMIFPAGNSVGLAMIGGRPLNEALEMIESGSADSVIVLESDLYRHMQRAETENFFKKCKQLIVIDSINTQTVMKADIVLPSATFAESDGTLINNEGRAQRYFKVYLPQNDVRESRHWLQAISGSLGKESFDDIVNKLTGEMPQFQGIENLKPPADIKIPRQSFRYSGRTALKANIRVSESKPPSDPDSSLAFSMEGIRAFKQTSTLPLVWAPGWNSAQAINKFQSEIGGTLFDGDPGVRLIETSRKNDYFFKPGKTSRDTKTGFRINAFHHIYGSEELSSHASALATRIPQPYLAMNPDDAGKLGIKEGSGVTLKCGESSQRLQIKLVSSLPAGNVGYPVGLPGMDAVDITGYADITKVDS